MKEILIGARGTVATKVVFESTAASCSGYNLPEVFSTPNMVNLMELASIEAIKSCYDEGELSVGAGIEMMHSKPTPIGMTVTAIAEVDAVNKNIITLKVEAFDEKEMVGSGIHKRGIIQREGFENMIKAKQEKFAKEKEEKSE